MTDAEARALTRRHIATVLEGDLDGRGESVMKEVWEEVTVADDTDRAFNAANEELRAIIAWLRERSGDR